ncbi:MAG TPA: mycothiol system anti-sigma-R factor [Cyclobacteriaceae bacterium]|jgi:anti-sigma factor (TIGR02949 family)|nr:mycothiol system anti-sigma-R factor [Cyclobacteriaceae bacterium]
MSTDQNNMKTDCANKGNCLEMLQLILDGEATPEQKANFKSHIDECLPCFKHYHFDQAIKELLKLKCSSQAPADLIESIRSKIKENTIS